MNLKQSYMFKNICIFQNDNFIVSQKNHTGAQILSYPRIRIWL